MGTVSREVLDEGPTMRGTARRAKEYLGRVDVRMVGKGGLANILEGGHYKGVTVRMPAQDIADGDREQSTADASGDA